MKEARNKSKALCSGASAGTDGEPSRRRIALRIAYDGTDFCGWQRQKREPSVQEALEKALEAVHKRPVGITGSGRTDSGVHAAGQVAHFDSGGISLPASRFPQALHRHLPPSIRILHAWPVSEDFHSRYQACCRVYRYYLSPGASVVPPDRIRYRWPLGRRPSMEGLNALCRPLLGQQDFTTFSAAGDASESRVRRIFSAGFLPLGADLVFEIAGNAFLWRMVRSLVGTLLEMEARGAGPAEMQKALYARDRSLAGPTAPARGLFLQQVLYKGDIHGYLY